VTRILCVERQRDNIYLIKMRLEMIEGFELTVAKDGAEGVSLALSDPPDLILMDLNLPIMNGWEAAQRLKADQRTAGIPVVALSAHAMAGDRERALAAGCDEFDIDFDRLVQKIRNLVAS
jgi:two-component system, cell cycle response regulator DivK